MIRRKKSQEIAAPGDVQTEVAALRREVERLNSHRFITIHNSIWRLLLLRFATGLFTGLGTVIGATVLVSIVVVWLQRIEWVPLIGEWAVKISEQIEINMSDATEPAPGEDATAPSPDQSEGRGE